MAGTVEVEFEDNFPFPNLGGETFANNSNYNQVAFRSLIAARGGISVDQISSRTVTKTVGPAGSVADYICDGVADEAEINAAIDAVSAAGGGIVHIKAGTYNQGASTHVLPKSNVVLQGEGISTKIVLATGKSVKIDQQSNVTIRDLYIDGTNQVVNNFGVYVDRSSDVEILNCRLLNMGGFGIFTTNQTAGTTVQRFRYSFNKITGACNNDLIGGGPGAATSDDTDFIITNNIVIQDGTMTGAGTYLNALDIVSLKKATIANNCFYGGCLLGGEKIPHQYVNVVGNVISPPLGLDTTVGIGRIAVLTASNASETDVSSCINVIGNQIVSGQVFIQGQSSTSSRTQKVVVANNIITGTKTNAVTGHNYGINLNYMANVHVSGNIVDGSSRGISLSDVQEISITDNKFLNCTTNYSGASVTSQSGRNNLGINPDIQVALGNVSGALTVDRSLGRTHTATLTGNITPTITDGIVSGDELILKLTQDGTGSRTVTWPANFKKAGGSLTLTTTAGATDVVRMQWDGTNWNEVARSLNIS